MICYIQKVGYRQGEGRVSEWIKNYILDSYIKSIVLSEREF